MGCAYCSRPVWASVRTGIGELELCETCFGVWERRRGGAPLQKWIRAIKPPARSHPACPSCGATPDQIRQTGLYGCCFCYVFLKGNGYP